MKRLHFTVPVPSSTKNSRILTRTKSGGIRSLPSHRSRRTTQNVRAAALQALLELEAPGGMEALFGPDDSIGVKIVHEVATGLVHVEVWSEGPKPAGKTGRGRDIDNMATAILDAIQGVAFGNDRQVSWLQVKRV
jgi:hypothetical protein